MAGPGEPIPSEHDDDQIGFASSASLRGRHASEAAHASAAAQAVLEPARPFAARERAPSVAERSAPQLFTGYVLILLGVPTLGVSILIGLLFFYRRAEPTDLVGRSHARYQRRTLLAATGAGVVGLVLLVVGLGVVVLFALALWVIARGAAGLWSLRAGRGVSRPDHWWI